MQPWHGLHHLAQRARPCNPVRVVRLGCVRLLMMCGALNTSQALIA